MSDLRKAAEAVLESWGWDWSEPRNEALRERMEALRQALAQPEQEPVAWRNTETGEFCTGGFLRKDLAKWMPLYTALPKREWVGLTDEELLTTYGWIPAPGAPDWILNGAKEELLGALRKVEAKLKEKNGG